MRRMQLTPLSGALAVGAAGLGIAGLAAVASTPLRGLMHHTSDAVETFIARGGYQLGPTLQRFSQELATLRDQEGVVTILLDGLLATLNLSGIAFVALPEGLAPHMLSLLEPEDLRARRDYATAGGRARVLAGLATLDVSLQQLVPNQPVLPHPWPGCAALVVIGSATASEDGLALLVIGPRRDGIALRPRDMALLATVAHQAATALANALLLAGLNTSLSQVRISTEQLVSARAEQQLLLRELVSADERQRAALARELHDDALQEALYLIRHSRLCTEIAAQLDRPLVAPAVTSEASFAASSAAVSNTSRGATLDRLRQELRQVTERSTAVEQKLRALCQGLYPALLGALGLPAALDELGRELADDSGIAISVTCDEPAQELADQLDIETSLHIYRIVQEALRNATKHARASQAWVRLASATGDHGISERRGARRGAREDLLTVCIEDDGAGLPLPLDFAALLHAGHLGLAGMRERAERIGGTLAYSMSASGGARISLQLPVECAR